MRYILYEIKKHVSFRETWVAYALGIGYLIAKLLAKQIELFDIQFFDITGQLDAFKKFFHFFLVINGPIVDCKVMAVGVTDKCFCR